MLTVEGDVAEGYPYWLSGVKRLSRTDSDQSFQTIRDWIKDCMIRHACSEPIWVDHFKNRIEMPVDDLLKDRPTRLIDLNAFSADSPDASLVRGDAVSGHFIALSHCWGSDLTARYCTTTENIESRISCIRYSELTRTFQDSFTIARKLEVRFLWIDSICIIQDSRSDWETEAAKMGSVYSNAFLTIAADFSEDGHGGCFNQQSRDHLDHFKLIKIEGTLDDGNTSTLFIHDDSVPSYVSGAFARSRLFERAWTCQEHLLSRKVLHYTDQQLFWECRRCYKAEDSLSIWGEGPGTKFATTCGTIELLRKNAAAEYRCENELRSYHKTSMDVLKNAGNDNVVRLHDQPSYLEPRRALLYYWYSEPIAENFSSRKLTYALDRLPALSGIARVFNQDLQAEYLAGIWLCSFEFGLCWYRVGPPMSNPARYQAPSFSWASLNSHVHWDKPPSPLGFDHSPYFTHVSLEGFQIETTSSDTYGAVSGGWLKLNGRLRRAKVVIAHNALCDGCDKITCIRHKCTDCSNFDYCSTCVANAGHTHPGHRFQQLGDCQAATASIIAEGLLQGTIKEAKAGSTELKLFWEDCEVQPDSKKNQVHFDIDYTNALPGCIYCLWVMSSSLLEQTSTLHHDFRRIGLAEFSKKEADSLFADVTQDIVTII